MPMHKHERHMYNASYLFKIAPDMSTVHRYPSPSPRHDQGTRARQRKQSVRSPCAHYWSSLHVMCSTTPPAAPRVPTHSDTSLWTRREWTNACYPSASMSSTSSWWLIAKRLQRQRPQRQRPQPQRLPPAPAHAELSDTVHS